MIDIPYQYIQTLLDKTIYETSNINAHKPPLFVVQAFAREILKTPQVKEKIDLWQAYKTPKDCEDFALEMQSELARYGYGNQFSNLLIVQLWNNEYHVVLEINTDSGIVYFDNLQGVFKKLEDKIIKRQKNYIKD